MWFDVKLSRNHKSFSENIYSEKQFLPCFKQILERKLLSHGRYAFYY